MQIQSNLIVMSLQLQKQVRNAESTNTNTYNIPNAHTVTINQIVKDYGSNVTPEDINNAVQVINKQMQQLNKVLHYLLILQVVVQQPYQLS